MNNPATPFAISDTATAVAQAFPLPPFEAYAEDFSTDADPFAEAPLDLGPPTPDALLDALPSILRIQSLRRLLEDDMIVNRATLCYRGSTLCVDWITQQVDTRLHRNGLVSIRRAATTRCKDGATRIQRLLPVTRPMPSFNLFDTLLPGWVKDPDLALRAAALWEALPRPLGHLINAVLWDSDRLHRFVTGPSSIAGHHNELSGNFRHSIEVAERAQALGQKCVLANVSLLIAGGLLHDVAKAAEYRYDRSGERFLLSDRGELIGHRDTLIEWLAVARQSGGVIIVEAIWLALLHMLNAARGAPAWLGIREPRSIEAELLSMADRLSGNEDLHQRCAPKDGGNGFGSYHRHLGHRTYVTQEAH